MRHCPLGVSLSLMHGCVRPELNMLPEMRGRGGRLPGVTFVRTLFTF